MFAVRIIDRYRWDPFSLLAELFGLPPVHKVTPLDVQRFESELQTHPDRSRVAYVLHGIRRGFRVGYEPLRALRSAKKNKQSALLNSHIVDQYLTSEVRKGRVAGPFRSSPLPVLQVSSFGVIPKRGQPGKWRLIVDLSAPRGSSVNDGIDPEQFTLQYIRVSEIAQMVSTLGQGALIAKFDVEAAYRNIPIHPSDRCLLGLTWRGKYFVDMVLPFGLRSAPYIFNSVASMVEWILMNNYGVSNLVHYLDDFIMAGPPESDQCANQLGRSLGVCHELGVPLNPAKCLGPSTTMVVLGIELDSVNQIARLPLDKLLALHELIQSWSGRGWCNRHQLESLIGHLHHAAKVVWQGRAFIRRMIDLLSCFRKPGHPIRINGEFRRDLEWWQTFLRQWNGISFWLYSGPQLMNDASVVSDASGAIGYGAFHNQQWFQGGWAVDQMNKSIAYKELFPIVVAANVWGSQWWRQHILFQCDNEAVVHVLNRRTSKIPDLMHLIRNLLLVAARSNFSFSAQHIAGASNSIADALSRCRWQDFRLAAPLAHELPTPVPPQLCHELAGTNWNSGVRTSS